MKCAWKELMAVVPPWVGREADRQGRDTLQELRLRLGKPPELVMQKGSAWLERTVSRDDLNFCINTASRYSPWAAQTVSRGYITAPGGHRIGLCGEAVIKNGLMAGMRETTSVCIRVARDFPGIAEKADRLTGSILLIGPPGSGKTTLLRDLIRRASQKETVCVVDERGELFPGSCFEGGKRLDVLTGCGKPEGIDAVLRTMGPSCIAVDEITAEEDCQALIRAGWCGVRLLATAHAASLEDLRSRPVYAALAQKRLIDHVLILSRYKSRHAERMNL